MPLTEVRTRRLERLSPEQRRQMIELLQRQAETSRDSRAIPRRPGSGPAPLSFAQQRLWFVDRLVPGSSLFNLCFAVLLDGDLDASLLERSLREVVRRHEVLRSRFSLAATGEPVQEAAPEPEIELAVVDLRGDEGAAAVDLVQGQARRLFDLGRGPLVRATLARRGEREHLLVLAVHHIVFDHWSAGNLIRELTTIYEAFAAGESPLLPELTLQYADYAIWQRERLQGDLLERLRAYWRGRLAGAPAVADLPLDRPRPAVRGHLGAQRLLRLGADLVLALAGLGRETGATRFMILLAGWQALLGRCGRQGDVVVGSPIAGRTRAELEPLIGLFVNLLALRVELSDRPGFRVLVERAREATLGAYEHQELPFEKVVEDLHLERSVSHTPVFQASFALQSAPPEDAAARRLRSRALSADNGTSPFDLSLSLGPVADGLAGQLTYSVELFDAPTVERLGERLLRLLAEAAANPETPVEELPLLSPVERQQLCEWSFARESCPAERCLHELFAEQAVRTPDAVAVAAADGALSYGELRRRGAALARRLLAHGVQPGDRVGLLLERGAGIPIAVLGVLGAGGAYVPLDPGQPVRRLQELLADAGARRVVAAAAPVSLAASWIPLDAAADAALAGLPGERQSPGSRLPAGSPAYVIYTSGSTGRPKGVLVSHANVVRLFAATRQEFAFGTADVWTLFHSYTFDFSVWELWGALLHGGCLVIVPGLVSRSPEDLLQLLLAEGVTVLNQTPSAFRELARVRLASGASLPALRFVVFGGEALQPPMLAPWIARWGDERPQLVNMYGITETTVHVTWCRLRRHEAQQPASVIGVPIADLALHVLDAGGRPVPSGVAGEIYVGGAGVASGYLGRPALTAERFMPDPFGGRPGARLYRSGDLGRWHPRGLVEHLGRADDQVKVRGFRIEPGEIESALVADPRVAAAAVMVREDGAAGGRQLVAYVVAVSAPLPAVDELRRHLSERLPDYMIPAAFVELSALPLTPNGKLDRRALAAAPAGERPGLAAAFAAPRNATEEILCDVWAQVLGVERVGISDNFFTLGGDSILSLRVVAQGAERGLGFSLTQLTLHQTVAGLAASLDAGQGEPSAVEASAPFSLISAADRARLPAGIEDAYPLASLQAGMLYHMELSPGAPLYHNVISWHLVSAFEESAFRAAVRGLTARHPVLRTSFDLRGFAEPLQLVHREAEMPVEVVDLRHLTEGEQQAVIEERVSLESRRLFDLSRPPQLRLIVHLRSSASFQLTVAENHAILDGWSLHSMMEELFRAHSAILAGDPPPTAVPLPFVYRDFVLLEQRSAESQPAAAFWSAVLDGLPPAALPAWPDVELAGETPREGVERLPIDAPLLGALGELARLAKVPLKSVFLTAHLQVLSLLTGRSAVATGLLLNGRPETPGGDQVLGLFLNTLPLRMQLEDLPWLELAQRTHAAERELLPYRRYPLAALQRQRGQQALIEVSFNYLHFHIVQGLLGAGRVEVLDALAWERSNFKLVAHFIRTPDSGPVRLQLEYDPAQVPAGQAAWIRGLYARVLEAMAGAPGERPSATCWLTAPERQLLLREWNDTAAELADDRCLAPLIAEQAARTPDGVAVEDDGGRQLSYGELDDRAARLARRLLRLGAAPEVPVAICAERSLEMVVGVLAILKTGAAYVPLDPTFPRDRLAFMVDDALGKAEPALLLAEERFAHWFQEPQAVPATATAEGETVPHAMSRVPRVIRLDAEAAEPDLESSGEPTAAASPDNLAVILYTSGSTGWPKGVLLHHRGILNRLLWAQGLYRQDGRDVVLHKASLGFDASIWEIFAPLLAGSRLVLARPDGHRDSAYLVRVIAERDVTLAHFVPSMMAAFLEEPGLEACTALRHVFSNGEAVTEELRDRFLARFDLPLDNQYGPTEITIDNTRWVCRRGQERRRVPIGRPIPNTRVYVVDVALRPAVLGVPGELVVGGCGVARGYLGRPELTAERFVPDPEGAAGDRLYRTGDLGRWSADGELECLGRMDQQVKIRGFRVEPGEVEAVLVSHPEVRESAVVVRQDRAGAPQLVAYLVPRAGEPRPDELRAFLRQRLPEAMVPAHFVVLSELPRLPNGKLSRNALPEPRSAPADVAAPPRGPLEESLAAIWRELLGIEAIGRDQGFFDLGGHSLLLLRLRQLLQARLARDVSTLDLLRFATIATLAAHLDGGSGADAEIGEVAAAGARQGSATADADGAAGERQQELASGRDRRQERRRRSEASVGGELLDLVESAGAGEIGPLGELAGSLDATD